MDDLEALRQNSESNIVRCPDQKIAKEMIALIADPALQKRLQIYTSGEAIIK